MLPQFFPEDVVHVAHQCEPMHLILVQEVLSVAACLLAHAYVLKLPNGSCQQTWPEGGCWFSVSLDTNVRIKDVKNDESDDEPQTDNIQHRR